MIDIQVQRLLSRAVDTPTKLHLLQICHEHPCLNITPTEMAERSCRDIWSVSQALCELAEDGILQVAQTTSEIVYDYQPHPEYLEPIRRLMLSYDDPIKRATVRRSISELASRAYIRHAPAHDPVF
jgi:DNA-binding GntR family transcriptional regulator